MASQPWSILVFSGANGATPTWERLDKALKARLQHMEPILAERDWLAGCFSVADILMADVLRLVDRFDGLAGYPACRACLPMTGSLTAAA
jgi:glutathione S-transferase